MPIKKIVFFVILIASVIIINNLVQSIYTLWQKKNLVVKAQLELEKEKKENQELKEKLAQVKQPQFIEKEARNKLFLAKPGEGVIVIPTGAIKPSPSIQQKPKDTRPNWQKWWETFF